jgi:hypothetical protein
MRFLLSVIFFVIASHSLIALENVRVLYADTRIFNDIIIFSIKVENKRNENIYILLDYSLEKIEYQESIKTVFATVSGKPYSLEFDDYGYYPSDFIMPNINIVAPGQKQLFHIIIKNYRHNIPKGVTILRTALEGINCFISEPPCYDFWGSSIGFYSYKLYSDFYKRNSHLLDSYPSN